MLNIRFFRVSSRLSLAVLFLLCLDAAATDVQGVRLYRAPDNTRIVFDLSAEVQNSVTVIPAQGDQPGQVVIEIANTALGAQVMLPDTHGTPVTKIRTEMHNNDLRTVLEMSSDVAAKSFLLKPNAAYGHRLVVDLADKVVVPEAETAPPPPSAPQGRDIVIVVDAGHGGEDPGAGGPHGLHEKNITLKIAKELASVIDQHPGYHAHLTRATDYFIPLQGRSKIAMDQKADLFVSIHADAFRDRSAHGASVFAWSQRGATSTMAQFLADDENLSDLMGGAAPEQVDDVVAKVVADLSIDGNVSYSLAMGHDILNELGQMTHLHRGHVEQAGFMVLKSVRVPSLLVETGFISNPAEADHLNSPDYEHQLAQAVFTGINQHFTRVPPPGTYIASLKGSAPTATVTPAASAPDTSLTTTTPAATPVHVADIMDVVPAETPAPKAVNKVAVKSKIHIVKRGETLSSIADQYGVSMAELKKHNRLKTSRVLVGQRLKIPA